MNIDNSNWSINQNTDYNNIKIKVFIDNGILYKTKRNLTNFKTTSCKRRKKRLQKFYVDTSKCDYHIFNGKYR